MSRFPYVENLLHFNSVDFPVNFIEQFVSRLFWCLPTNVIIKIRPALLLTLYNTKNIAHHITEELIFSADKIMVVRKSQNLRVFNFAILLMKI